MTAYLEARDLPPGETMSEYLSVADLGPGETRAVIDEVESLDGQTVLRLKDHAKPIVLNREILFSLSRSFQDGNSQNWFGRTVVLSSTGGRISVTAPTKPGTPHAAAASAPQTSLAIELADLLARAITTPQDRANMISLLRGAADLLLARQ
jgi:hypothetical protein